MQDDDIKMKVKKYLSFNVVNRELVNREYDSETSCPLSSEIAAVLFMELTALLSEIGGSPPGYICYNRFIKDKMFPAIFLLPRSLK